MSEQHHQQCLECGEVNNALVDHCAYCNAPLSIENDPLLGITLGNLQLIRSLGSGAMGTVYLARHTILRTPYAIKVMDTSISSDQTAVERFQQEAMVGSILRHPNIAFVTDFGLDEKAGLYIVMEYLPGQPLTNLLGDSSELMLWEILHIVKQICSALEAAHMHGTVHRDLKPDNIFILNSPGQSNLVKILDWGLARLINDRRHLDVEGMVFGTPIYMSPEQVVAKEDEIGPLSDLYTLSLILFEMLTGAPPFSGTTSEEVMLKHVHDAPPLLSEFRPEFENTRLEALLTQLMSKSPEQRPQNTKSLIDALELAFAELRELNIPDVDMTPHDVFYGDGGAISFDDIREADALLDRFNTITHLNALPPTLSFLTRWGLLSFDLLLTPTESPLFDRCVWLSNALISTFIQNAYDAEEQQQVRLVLNHSLSHLFQLCDNTRQKRLITGFQPVITSPLFPHSALPEWARPRVVGTWQTVGRTLSFDLRRLFQSEDSKDESEDLNPDFSDIFSNELSKHFDSKSITKDNFDFLTALEAIGIFYTPDSIKKVHEWKLPSESGFDADFCREDLSHKLSKLFKQELQVGIPEFDNAVFITTSNLDLTAQFLKSQPIRDIVLQAIGDNGNIRIQGELVSFGITSLSIEQMAFFTLLITHTCL